MKLTKAKYASYQKEKEELELLLEQKMVDQEKAKSHGDLSENEENNAISNEINIINTRIRALAGFLHEAEIVTPDNSPRIGIGNFVSIEEVDDLGKVIKPAREFKIDNEGDTILAEVLSISSPLGKIIINGTDGMYSVPSSSGETIHYRVRKIFDKE